MIPAQRLGGAGLLVALALIVTPSVTRAQGDFPTELKTVGRVRLEGRRNVPAKEIWAVLKTRRPSWLPWRDRPVLRQDFLAADARSIEAVCRQHGFLDARAEYRLAPSDDKRSMDVTFVIEEGRRSMVTAVDLIGFNSVPADQIRKKLYSRPERPFNPSAMIVDTARISEAYKERGHLPNVIASSQRDSYAVTVRYEVEEGPVYHNGQVMLAVADSVAGVNERLVRRELLLREGQVYRASRVQRSVERLYETGLFSQVRITPLVDTVVTEIDFSVGVRSRKPRWIDAGVGSGTAERFRFTGEWGHRNLAGRGIQGVLAARLAFDGQARFLLSRLEASLLEPWLLRSRTRGLLTIYHENRNDRADPRWVVEQEGDGASFQIRRDIGRLARIALTQDNAFVTQNIRLLDQNLPQPVRDSLTLDVKPSYTTHRLQLGADRDSRDDPLNATRGSAQNLTGEVAGGLLRGASNFTKWQFSTATYTPFRNGWVLAARVRGGAIDPFGTTTPQFSPDADLDAQVARVPLEDRFRIGGVNSLRGYNENEIPRSGGLALFLGNVELRIPVVGPFGLEVFLDVGNVWARPGYIKMRNFVPEASDEPMDPSDVHYLFGAGARVNLPFGPLRVDFTWSPRPDERGVWKVAEPQFAIGPTF